MSNAYAIITDIPTKIYEVIDVYEDASAAKELELDYDEENDIWKTMKYSSNLEAAFDLFVTAFQGDTHDYGLDFDTVETALYDADIPYVA